MQKIFLVEDSPLVRERLNDLLGSVADTRIVGHASTAEAAIAGILADRPDIVLLDLRLARGSGLDVLRAVRSSAPEIDFYMLSNYASDPYRQLAERLGARGYFDKSRDFERVRAIIAERAAGRN